MNIDLKYYFSIFLRRFHYFALVSTIVSILAVTLALILPPRYDAKATLLMESSQIPGEMAAPTVVTAAMERLQIIENQLMTRANLLDIANRLKVFPDQEKMNPDQVVEAMVENTTIVKTAGRDMATLMSLNFTADRAAVTAQVVNEYVTLILQEDLRYRTARAGTTLDFFENRVEQLGAELDRQGEKILAFKNANADALPDSLDFRLTQQALLQERLATMERDIASLTDQRNRLVQIFNTTGRISGLSEDLRTPEQKQLDTLKDQLAQSLAVYSESNPRVRMLQAQITQLEAVVLAQGPAPDAEVTETSMLDLQLAEIDARIESLNTEKAKVVTSMDDLTASIDKTPANAISLQTLERDNANTQEQYNTAVARLSEARTGSVIETASKGERITVIESATVPEEMTSPNRPLIAIGGVLAGVMLGIGLIAVMEFLNQSVRRPVDLVRRLGVTPIATLPYIRTKGEAFGRRAIALGATVFVVLGVPAALYAVHTFYLPLDLLVESVMAKVGVRL